MVVVMRETSPKPIVLDCALDYKVSESRFYARDDIDRKVDMPAKQVLVGNDTTGEIKTIRE